MPLPDFLIIGSAKCGTEACARNLSRHPEIRVGPAYIHPVHGVEWIKFFTDADTFTRGAAWYSAQFQEHERCPACGRNGAKKTLGDRSTWVLENNEAHGRVHATLPGAKLIALLRNPISRAYSHWNHFYHRPKNAGLSEQYWGQNSFEETIGLSPRQDGRQDRVGYAEVLSQGHYVENLEHLFTLFPREQVHIAISERVLADMRSEYARMFCFLGVVAGRVAARAYRESNSAEDRWPYPGPMSPESRAWLTEYYRPHNERLFNLLGEEITEWLMPASAHEGTSGQSE